MGVPLVGDGTGGLSGVTGTATGGGNGVAGVSDSANGVSGLSTTNGDGVHGSSSSGSGVAGQSQTGYGVSAVSQSSEGVHATSAHKDGVHGINGAGSGTTPKYGSGVRGESADGYGVYGASKTASGVYGTSGPGHFAGEFAGDVSVVGSLSTVGLTTDACTVSGNLTARDVILSGADCAEEFDIANAGQLDSGTVVVFDGEGAISQTAEPYNKRVAGVISGAGKYRPGVVLGRDGSSGEGKAPVALVGRVYCKVDASYSPLELGDMLTTSPTPGFAMKASDPSRAFGAVIGKALAPVAGGRALIPILVTLQ